MDIFREKKGEKGIKKSLSSKGEMLYLILLKTRYAFVVNRRDTNEVNTTSINLEYFGIN